MKKQLYITSAFPFAVQNASVRSFSKDAPDPQLSQFLRQALENLIVEQGVAYFYLDSKTYADLSKTLWTNLGTSKRLNNNIIMDFRKILFPGDPKEDFANVKNPIISEDAVDTEKILLWESNENLKNLCVTGVEKVIIVLPRRYFLFALAGKTGVFNAIGHPDFEKHIILPSNMFDCKNFMATPDFPTEIGTCYIKNIPDDLLSEMKQPHPSVPTTAHPILKKLAGILELYVNMKQN